MTRVAVIAHRFPCFSETFVVDHVVGLARRGFEVVVLCDTLDTGSLARATERASGRLAVHVVTAGPRDLRFYAEAMGGLCRAALRSRGAVGSAAGRGLLLRAPLLARALRAVRPDAIHAHFASNGLVADAAMEIRLPLIVDMHGWDFTVLPRLVGWGSLRHALRSATLVAHSAFAEEKIERGIGRRPHRVHLGVDLPAFQAPPRPPAWRSPLRLLCVGRLVAHKGPAVALAALAELRRPPGAVEARLRFVGEGPERSALEFQARQLGLGDSVEFAGALGHAEVAREMIAADMLLVPSIRGADGAEEAFGRVALEGMAAGMPVVASSLGGLPETVGTAGWLVPPGDPTALARHVREILVRRTPEDCERPARSRAAAFPLERMWDEYEAITQLAVRG